ncbi:sulfite exporter TauE/SafE family protein [Cryptosporangium arvum]|uniref:sulfite exporter TauE/SafE family protein n=1 Tax=Cryptosporangium arvum TaxID=80871 RepID=UPI0004B9D3B8|nr:sulfite exporter TauE/SafE family protein [Cryptosporangium arvum]
MNSPVEYALVLFAGLGSGLLISTVGFASLLSFPVLLAVGLPPVVANVSNTIGLTPAGLSGSFGYRRELREQPLVTTVVLVTCAGGAVLGVVLLLALPPGVFAAVVPYLILVTCLLVGAQPFLSKRLRRRERGGARLSAVTTAACVVVGVYGGYFGGGSGVMMMAVLGFGADLPMRVVNALKTLSIAAGNVVASVLFVVVADVNWAAAGLLALGSAGGGYVGALIGRRLPATLLRVLIVLAGITAAVTMLL